MTTSLQHCPCGSTTRYQDCCALVLADQKLAATAVQLMRSRYSAYVNGQVDYLLQSWHKKTRPKSLQLDPEMRFQQLTVVNVWQGAEKDKVGKVEFIARYQYRGKTGQIHETSRFRKESGIWYYLDGHLFDESPMPT